MPFDSNSSQTTVYDYSENDNDGTITNAVYTDSGKIGGAMSFDGDGDYVRDGSFPELSTGSINTFSMWLKTSVNPASDFFHKPITWHDGSDGFGTSIDTDGVPFIWTLGGNTIGDGDDAINDGEWHHVVFIFDQANNNAYTYVDGVLDGSNTSYTDNSDTSGGDLTIGTRTAGGEADGYWDGSIDEVMIFNRSLSADEVGEIYNSTYSRFHPQGNQTFQFQNFTQDGTYNRVNVTIESQQLNGTSLNGRLYEANIGNNTGYVESGDESLVGYWHLDGDALDYSGQGNDGTLQGNPTNTTGMFANAYDFDGSGDYISIPDDNSLDTGSDLTVLAWTKGPNQGAVNILVSKYDTGGDERSWQLASDTSTHLRIANFFRHLLYHILKQEYLLPLD
jgi:hypothetical protein